MFILGLSVKWKESSKEVHVVVRGLGPNLPVGPTGWLLRAPRLGVLAPLGKWVPLAQPLQFTIRMSFKSFFHGVLREHRPSSDFRESWGEQRETSQMGLAASAGALVGASCGVPQERVEKVGPSHQDTLVARPSPRPCAKEKCFWEGLYNSPIGITLSHQHLTDRFCLYSQAVNTKPD